MNSEKIADGLLRATVKYLRLQRGHCDECADGVQETFDLTNGKKVTRACPTCQPTDEVQL